MRAVLLTGLVWGTEATKYSKMILTVKKKGNSKIKFRKTFKCAQDFAEIIARAKIKQSILHFIYSVHTSDSIPLVSILIRIF